MNQESQSCAGPHAPGTLGADITRHIVSFLGHDARWAGKHDVYKGLAYTLRERLADLWIMTQRAYYDRQAKRVYYLSMEFLAGRSLMNTVINLGVEDEVRRALDSFGLKLEDVCEMEWDAGLGNGGLGRLASCYLDSMATTGVPGYGYGIRYDYGIFYQTIQDGYQVEQADNWLRFGNPWEFERPEHLYPVEFGGQVRQWVDGEGRLRHDWVNAEVVMAMACDMMIPGYKNSHVINMRLWAAKSSREFNLQFFNNGQYIKAIEDKARSENISKVLYPNDELVEGQELRLKQQYFFVAATLKDITRRFSKRKGDWRELPRQTVVQLNDTHPAIGVAELMRILVDVELIPWDEAWDICREVFAYTNHTVMPEALECWSVDLMSRVLPRHVQIIFEINRRFLNEVRERFPDDPERAERMAVVTSGRNQLVRMAHLAIVGSHSVNGVSALHTQILKERVFKDFYEIYPERFNNKTNGITPRRWLKQANPDLAVLIAEAVGEGFVTDLDRLEGLRPLADDASFRERWGEAKRRNKKRLADYVWEKTQIAINWDSLFDVQVKRIHEYKRQLLNVLHAITLYNRIKDGRVENMAPRVCIFGGKAAPAYKVAKLIIKLINSVSKTVNADPGVGDMLKVVFVPNYCVSNAEIIIPGTDLSEQISLAGTEASGTGNMKFALNGALTIGTLDGANVEIGERVGFENIFIFGLKDHEAATWREHGYAPWEIYQADRELKRAVDMIAHGHFCRGDEELFKPLADSLLGVDRYMVLADYRAYVNRQEDAARLFMDQGAWMAKSILNTAGMGFFSSDRAVREYAGEVWGVAPIGELGGECGG
jgi:starch phosphorylase